MVRIRLWRAGGKKAPFYRIVVADARAPRDGRFIEEIGYYNSLSQPEKLVIDHERLNAWQQKGAQLSKAVRYLLTRKDTHQ